MTAESAVMLVKKVTYFGEFSYLSSSCTRKSVILMFLSSSRDKFTLLGQTQWQMFLLVSGRVSAHPDGNQHGVSIQIFINLGEIISLHILLRKSFCYLNLGKGLCIFTFFLFPDSGLYLLNGIDFYFELFWRTWHWKLAIKSLFEGWRGGLMVSALDSETSGPGSTPGRGQCVVFLFETLYSHGASLHPGV